MARTISDVVALHGGFFDPSTLPPGLSANHFQNIVTVLNAFSTGKFPNATDKQLPTIDLGYSWEIAITASPSVDVRLHQLDVGRYLVVIPIGLYARMYILACRLITYWSRKQLKGFEKRMLDRSFEGAWRIPPLVAPVFEYFEDLNAFWTEVDRFQRGTQLNDRIWYDVARVINVSVIFALFHEQAHMDWLHSNPIRDFLIKLPTDMDPVRRLIRKGFELQADVDAANLGVAVLEGGIRSGGYEADDQKVATDFLRLGYAYTMVFGAFDPWHRSFAAYRRQDHPHPILRHNAVLESTWWSLRKNVSPRWAQLWGKHALVGFEKCIDALNWLSFDCLVNLTRPGPKESWRNLIPIHSLCHPTQIKRNSVIRRQISTGRLIKIAADVIVRKYEAGKLETSDLEALLPISQLIEREDIPLDPYTTTLERYLYPIFGDLVEQVLSTIGVEAGVESPFL
jgi:hypothetical protein